ncbi:MAG: DUF2726 domain-containing protein [Phycisphaerales bacterium]
MGDLVKLAGLFAVLFVGIGLLWLVAHRLGMLKPGKGDKAAADTDGPAPPYRIGDGVLTPGERAFFPALRRAMPLLTTTMAKPQLPLLLAKVRLADVIEVDTAKTGGNRSAATTARNSIDRKHVDFLLCDPAMTKPVLIVELDDPTHGRSDRKKRDEDVDAFCAAARYNRADLAMRLAVALK